MEIIKKMLAGVSTDKMIILLLIGWGFGNFLEGMAGFGTAVAIPAGILVAMGYDPITTVVACLVVNSTPTAFGSVGVPTSTVASITGLNALTVAGKIAILQGLITFLSPFFMVLIGGGRDALKKSWPAALVASLSFVIPQTVSAIFIGPEMPNIIGSVVCMIIMIIFALQQEKKKGNSGDVLNGLSVKEALVAWSPFLLIFVILLFTSSIFPVIHDPIASITSSLTVYTGEDPAVLHFAWLDCPGVKITIAGLIGGLIQKASFKEIVMTFLATVKANVKTIVTICSVLAAARIMSYSGMINAIAVMLVALTGSLYPLFSPLIGMIGGFVTGSGTSTAVLFGSLQMKAAEAVNVDPTWLVAANMAGGGIGKMIAPQNIAVGCAASGLQGQESRVLSKTFPYALIYIVIAGVICMLGA
jgi:lactate permease